MKQKIFFIMFVSLFLLQPLNIADAYYPEKYASRYKSKTSADRYLSKYGKQFTYDRKQKSGWYTPGVKGHGWNSTPAAENSYHSTTTNPYYDSF